MKERLIFCWSMKRGGTHATEHYVCQHYPESFLYKNTCDPNMPDIRSRTALRNEMNKDQQIYMIGFEDFDFFIESVGVRNIKDAIKLREYEGYYRRLFNIVVLRDPFNLLSSKLKQGEGKMISKMLKKMGHPPIGKELHSTHQESKIEESPFKDFPKHDRSESFPSSYEKIVENSEEMRRERLSRRNIKKSRVILNLWKIYAREYLRKTKHLPEIIPWNFNRWFVDIDYRKSLSSALDLEFTDAGKNKVSHWGSSFDDQDYDGRASEMDVLNRWQHHADNPEYIKAFDLETVELSKRIFDFAPQEIVKQIKD